MKYLLFTCLFCLFTMTSQAQLQRNLSVPRGDARTLIFALDEEVVGDSIIFSTSLSRQETFNYSSSVTVRRASRTAYDGDDQQVFVTDSINGVVQVYLGTTQTMAMSERQYFFTLRVNDTTKVFGTMTMRPTNWTSAVLTYLTDSTLYVSRTNPVIPGLGADTLGRTLKVDANGLLFNGYTQAQAATAASIADSIAALVNGSSYSNTKIPVSIDFTPVTAPAHAEGKVFYDSDNNALTVYNAEADVAMQVGEEEWIFVRNNSGATIVNGRVVYISGATGQIPTIALAQGDDTTTAMLIGVATHDIENNTSGYVTRSGLVRDLNTSNYGDGTSVYLSVDSAGVFTLNKPTFPNVIKRVGTVAYSHASTGKLLVDITVERDTTNQNTADIYKAFEDDIASKPNADSVHSVLDTLGAFALSVAQLAQTTADTAGTFALLQAQAAWVLADTTGTFALLVAQAASVAATTAQDSANVHGAQWWNFSETGGSTDSVLVKTRIMDSASVKVDSISYQTTELILPTFVPGSETAAYAQRTGRKRFYMVWGGTGTHFAAARTFAIRTDSTNNVSATNITYDVKAYRIGASGAMRTQYVSYWQIYNNAQDNTVVFGLMYGSAVTSVSGPNTGSPNYVRLDVLSTTAGYMEGYIDVSYTIPATSASDWYVTLTDE